MFTFPPLFDFESNSEDTETENKLRISWIPGLDLQNFVLEDIHLC